MKLSVVPIVIALVVVGLTACGTPNVSRESYQGTPRGFDPNSNLLNGQPGATWLSGRGAFAIVTYGSATCAPIPTGLEVTDEHSLEVTFAKAPNGSCSTELSATTYEFDLPSAIAAGSGVTIEVLYDFEPRYEFTLRLP
jgi:hypothetical protein